MIEVKKSLYSYMTNFPRSFVGFFELMSEILNDLGVDWGEHSKKTDDTQAAAWSAAFSDASKVLHNISEVFEKLRTEFEAREEAKVNADPAMLIQNFKARVEKIKNGNTSM